MDIIKIGELTLRVATDPKCPPGTVYVLDGPTFYRIVQEGSLAVFERGMDALPDAVRETIAKVRAEGNIPVAIIENVAALK
jgi:hypothetical protein